MAKSSPKTENNRPLTFDPHNANLGTDRGREMLLTSLEKYGAGRSILADRNGVVIAGNKTLEAAEKLGLPIREIETDGTELVVVRRRDLDLDEDPSARELAYADNRIAEVDLQFDPAVLLADMEAGVDLSGLWDDEELEALLARAKQGESSPPVPGAGGDDYKPDPERAPALCEEGDLWAFGDRTQHRLLCGDSTNPSHVERLTEHLKQKVHLCLTDPPYGVGWKYDDHEDTVENLTLLVAAFLPKMLDACEVVLISTGIANMWLYPKPDHILCWRSEFSSGVCHWGFTTWNPVLVYGKDPYLKNRMGSRPDSVNIIETPPPGLDHPCPKPMKTWQWLLERGTIEPGQTVLDPFMGSGTTLIAAHRTGRIALGIEKSPRYCDTILERARAEGLEISKLS